MGNIREAAKKIYMAFMGFCLMLCKLRIFKPKYLDGKRVAVIGPADSAIGTGNGKHIDDFDIVIRINKAPRLIESKIYEDDIGHKTDILFHTFFENDLTGGGELNFDLYKKMGIKYVINPKSAAKGLRTILNFYKKYLTYQTVYILPFGFYRGMKKLFGQRNPTTGFSALYTALSSEFKELYITGFTFFKTPTAKGYRDHLKDPEIAAQWMKEVGHDPDFEFNVFKKLLEKNKQKKIILDEKLLEILKTG